MKQKKSRHRKATDGNEVRYAFIHRQTKMESAQTLIFNHKSSLFSKGLLN
jgi:hypothetical protein